MATSDLEKTGNPLWGLTPVKFPDHRECVGAAVVARILIHGRQVEPGFIQKTLDHCDLKFPRVQLQFHLHVKISATRFRFTISSCRGHCHPMMLTINDALASKLPTDRPLFQDEGLYQTSTKSVKLEFKSGGVNRVLPCDLEVEVCHDAEVGECTDPKERHVMEAALLSTLQVKSVSLPPAYGYQPGYAVLGKATARFLRLFARYRLPLSSLNKFGVFLYLRASDHGNAKEKYAKNERISDIWAPGTPPALRCGFFRASNSRASLWPNSYVARLRFVEPDDKKDDPITLLDPAEFKQQVCWSARGKIPQTQNSPNQCAASLEHRGYGATFEVNHQDTWLCVSNVKGVESLEWVDYFAAGPAIGTVNGVEVRCMWKKWDPESLTTPTSVSPTSATLRVLPRLHLTSESPMLARPEGTDRDLEQRCASLREPGWRSALYDIGGGTLAPIFSTDGKQMMWCRTSDNAIVCTYRDGLTGRPLVLENTGGPSFAIFSPDDKWVLMIGNTLGVQIWPVDSWQQSWKLSNRQSNAIFLTANVVAVAPMSDSSIQIWVAPSASMDWTRSCEVTVFPSTAQPSENGDCMMATSPNGEYLAVARKHAICVWKCADLMRGKPEAPRNPLTLWSSKTEIFGFAFSTDSATLVCCSDYREPPHLIQLPRSTGTGETLRGSATSATAVCPRVSEVFFDCTGEYLVVQNPRMLPEAKIFRYESASLQTPKLIEGRVQGFTRDGRFLLVVPGKDYKSRRVQIWELQKHEVKRVNELETDRLADSFVVSPDLQLVIATNVVQTGLSVWMKVEERK